jgi:hypothetical protein
MSAKRSEKTQHVMMPDTIDRFPVFHILQPSCHPAHNLLVVSETTEFASMAPSGSMAWDAKSRASWRDPKRKCVQIGPDPPQKYSPNRIWNALTHAHNHHSRPHHHLTSLNHHKGVTTTELSGPRKLPLCHPHLIPARALVGSSLWIAFPFCRSER